MAVSSQTRTVMEEMSKVTSNTAQAMMVERDKLEKLFMESRAFFTLFGPPGTGKSSMARAKAKHHNVQPYPIQCSDQMSGASFYQIAWVEPDGSMAVRKGPGLAAYEGGGMFIAEEVNEASQDAQGVLTILLTRGHGASIRTMDNRLVTMHTDLLATLTMNGDPYELPERILDRAPAIPISCPSAAMLRTLPNDLARLTMRAYAAVHHTRLPDGLPFTFRQMQALAEFRQVADLPTAALVAFNGNREMAKLFCDTLLPLVAAPSGSRQKDTAA